MVCQPDVADFLEKLKKHGIFFTYVSPTNAGSQWHCCEPDEIIGLLSDIESHKTRQ